MMRANILAAACEGTAAEAVGNLLSHLPNEVDRSRIGFVVGTTVGCLEADRAFDESRRENVRFASPAAFAKTLPSTAAAQLALDFRLTGPSLVVSAGEVSTAVALRRAVAWMRHMRLAYVIAGGIEEGTRVGLLLIGDGGPRIGEVLVEAWRAVDLAAAEDRSLIELVRWIEAQEDASLGAGVRFVR
jgi:3-oxoacyl-(acyl-carrier-protein) synthase